MLAKAGIEGVAQRTTTPLTMFHQIMYFLVLQEEMTQEADTYNAATGNMHGGVSETNPLRNSNFFPRLLPEEEIQKVIFDTDYLDFISKK